MTNEQRPVSRLRFSDDEMAVDEAVPVKKQGSRRMRLTDAEIEAEAAFDQAQREVSGIIAPHDLDEDAAIEHDAVRTTEYSAKGASAKPKGKANGPDVPATDKAASALRFDDPHAKAPHSLLHSPTKTAVRGASDMFHRSVSANNEDENSAVTAADRVEQTGEEIIDRLGDHRYAQRLRKARRKRKAQRNSGSGKLHETRQTAAHHTAESAAGAAKGHQVQKAMLKKQYAAARKAAQDAQRGEGNGKGSRNHRKSRC